MNSSSIKAFLSKAIVLALVVGCSIAVVGYTRWIMQLDPFARYRTEDGGPSAQHVAVRLDDVRIWSWKDGELVMSCDVGRVDIRRDRQHLEFYDISNGVYNGESESFQFAGGQANYAAGMQLFQVDSGARVWNDDIELEAQGLRYRQRAGELRAIGAVLGKVPDGQFQAENVVYFPETKMLEAGPVAYEGKLPKALQEVAGDSALKAWKVKGASMKRAGELEHWGEAEATDGEIIVKAPKIERNVKTDVLTATGRVQYFGKKANLICDKAVIYRKERRAVLTGNVSMLVKPEHEEKLEVVEIEPFRPVVPEEIAATRPKAPSQRTEEQKRLDEELRSGKGPRKYAIKIRANRIEYWYKKGERRAVVTGSPEALQEFPNGRWRRMWSNRALYDGEKETLRLVSSEGKKDTRIKTSIGDDLVATWFFTSTKEEGEDNWEGEGVEGTVMSDDDEINRTGDPPPTTRTPPPALRGRIGRT